MRVVLLAPNSRPETTGLDKSLLEDLKMTASPPEAFYMDRGSYDLAVMHALLVRQGHEARIINAQDQDLGNKELLGAVSSFKPDFIAIVSTSNLRCYLLSDRHVLNAARLLKGMGKIILTGTLPSLFPETYKGYADSVIIGEYETALPELVANYEKRKTIDGIAYADKGRMKVNPGIRYADLGHLPAPEYGKTITPPPGHFSIYFSRGCPFSCSFCVKAVVGNLVRYRKVGEVIAEIKKLVKFGIRHIDFSDELFNFDNKKVAELCKAITRNRLKITYTVQTRADFLNEGIVRLMAESGCVRADIGLETGDETVLQKTGKRLSLDTVRHAVILLKKHGVEVRPFLIIGLPGESKGTITNTIRFVNSLGVKSIGALLATPYPGSRIYDLGLRGGTISGDYARNHRYEKLAQYAGTIGNGFGKKEIRELLKNFRIMYHLERRGLGFLFPVLKHLPISASYDIARKLKYAGRK